MADQTLKNLISLIAEADQPEVRRAALRVAAALKPAKERTLNQALVAVLDEPDAELRLLAVEALGAVHADEALPRLTEIVQGGGMEVDAAVRALGQLGSRGTKALVQVMRQAAPGLRRRIAATLALAGTESAVLATAHSLLDADPGVVEASAKSLAAEVPLLTNGQKRALTENLLEMLTPPSRKPSENKVELSPASEAGMLRILSALNAPQAEEIYWNRLDAARPVALRSAALHALAALPLSITDAKLKKLLDCAAATDFQVVAPALMLLKKATVTRGNVKRWLNLFDAPDVAAQQLAVEKLRELDTAEVATAMLRQLQHPDKGLRDQAQATLQHLKAGRQALFDALLQAHSADEAWRFARAQMTIASQWNSSQRTRLFEQAAKFHDKDDRRADAFWSILREVDRDWHTEQIQERALGLRKKKKYDASLSYWRLITRDPAVGAALRFEAAATALKLSNHDTSATARQTDPALQEFNRLVQDPSFDLIGQIRKAKWLEEGDLFYLGFHFAEQPRLAREFGKQVLELVMEKWPKSQAGKSAKAKLKSEGL